MSGYTDNEDQKQAQITCEACRRLEDNLRHVSYFSPLRDEKVATRIYLAAENLSKHREICEIYKGENDDK